MTRFPPLPGGHAALTAAPAAARLALSHADRDAAYRLRYEVYVAEQGKAYPDADHARRVLTDELDSIADVIVAERSGAIVGTVRATTCGLPEVFARYASEFAMHDVPSDEVSELGVCSRLAVHPECRDMTIRRGLFEAIYEAGMARGIRLCFASCAPTLLRMFRRVGFREYAAPMIDPHVGLRHRILLVMDDLDHLQRMQSPFVAVAQRLHVEPRERAALKQFLLSFESSHAEP